MPQFEAQAVQAGGMSGLGSRAGVQAGILGEGLQTRLGDIEAKGLQSSFLNAQQQFQNQKQREAAQASQTAALGPAMFSQGLAQQGALQTVGEQKQTQAQKALDEQYFKFLEQKAFPEEQLAKYSGFVYGNPLLSQRDVTSTAQSGRNFNQPSSGAQLLGTGLAAANTFRQIAPQTFGSFTSAINPFKGGGGLSDIVYRQSAGGLRGPDSSGRRYDPKPSATPSQISLDELKRREEKKRIDFRNPDAQLVFEDDTGLGGTGPYTGQGEYTGEIVEPIQTVTDPASLDEIRVGSGGVGLEGILGPRESRQRMLTQDQIDARMRPDMYDPNVVRRRAEERERSRESFYGKSDKERRDFNRSMADRRRAERDEDYQRRRKLVGEADPVGTLLSQLSQSLLRTRDYDETTGIGARLAEGLGNTTSRLSEADKERRAKLLKIEDEFGRRRAEESEKEFEAEGQLLSRGEEREALALAREFKLEDKILDLPYAKQRKVLELINAGLKGEKLKAEIKKLQSEAGGTPLDAATAKALDDTFKDQLTQVIPNAVSMEGVPMNAKVANLINAAKEKAQDAYIRGNEDATAARRSFQESLEAIREAMKVNPKYFSGE